MVTFPNCKINLGLNIVNKRNDGFHDIETIFLPAQLKDALEIIEKKDPEFSASGLTIEGGQKNNLCVLIRRQLEMHTADDALVGD